jgi:hypothetical protein
VASVVIVVLAAYFVPFRESGAKSANETADGRYAGTIFQHRHWLQQVLDAVCKRYPLSIR